MVPMTEAEPHRLLWRPWLALALFVSGWLLLSHIGDLKADWWAPGLLLTLSGVIAVRSRDDFAELNRRMERGPFAFYAWRTPREEWWTAVLLGGFCMIFGVMLLVASQLS